VEEWPLGNDGPRVAAAGSSVGRARSTASFTRFVTSESPATTTRRKTGIHRLGTRLSSRAPTATTMTTTHCVEARLVTSSRIRWTVALPWSWAHRAAA
jgi:hypothetical protein